MDALSRGVFAVARCRSCSLIIWPPNPLCRRCLSSDVEWVEMNPRMDEIKGKAIAVADSHLRGARFALIELENGIRLLGRIIDEDDDGGSGGSDGSGAGVGSQVMMVGCGVDGGDDGSKPYYLFKSLSAYTSNT